MPIDRKKFFDAIRRRPFGGSLTPSAVLNINAILDEWERRGLTDLRWLSYMLATDLAECGRNMAPIPEVGKGRGHPYGNPVNGHVYYGRGYVQLTWDYNYRKMGTLIGVDLLSNPDLALRPDIASKILFEGMIRGSFTGKKLADYFSGQKADWVNARRIINGTDRASEIANYGKQFHEALTGAGFVAALKDKVTTPESGAIVVGGGGATAVIVSSGGMSWGAIGVVVICIAVLAFATYKIIQRVKS